MSEDKESLNSMTDLFNDWSDAIVSNDADSIGSFMSDDWEIVSPTGTTTKEQFLGAVRSGSVTHDTFSFELARLRVYQETVVVNGRVRNTGLFNGEAFVSDEWASDVFVKLEGRWLCVFSHITPVSSTQCA